MKWTELAPAQAGAELRQIFQRYRDMLLSMRVAFLLSIAPAHHAALAQLDPAQLDW